MKKVARYIRFLAAKFLLPKGKALMANSSFLPGDIIMSKNAYSENYKLVIVSLDETSYTYTTYTVAPWPPWKHLPLVRHVIRLFSRDGTRSRELNKEEI